MTDAPAAVENHGVHRTDRLRVVGQIVEQRKNGLLARVGDVEAGKTHHLRRLDQQRKRVDASSGANQIDELVVQRKADVARFLLVHRG